MEERQSNPIFFLNIGYAGTLLIALGAVKFTVVFNDDQGYFLTFAGFILVTIFLRHMEKELGVKKVKSLWISKVFFMSLFLALSFWLYL